MRVAFFSTLTNAPWGGSEVLWSKAAQYSITQGNVVAAFVKQWDIDHGEITQLRKGGAEVYYHTTFRKQSVLSKVVHKLSESFISQTSPFSELIKWKPDFIFFNQGHSYDLGYYNANHLRLLIGSAIPFSIICQNNTEYSFIPEKDVRSSITKLFANANKVFFVSERNKETAELVLCKKVLNAGIIANSTSFSTLPVGTLPFPVSTVVQFGCVARLRCSHKGQNLLLHVLSKPKWGSRSWILNLYGEGEDEQYLKDLCRFFNLEHRVVFHGHTDNIQDIWLNNHVCLLSSFGEGMPIALQEAMLCGRPAVVTDVGGNSELITDGINGWLANGTTFSAFDAALERAWTNKSNWEEMGVMAHQQITEKIDLAPEITLDNYFKLVVEKTKT